MQSVAKRDNLSEGWKDAFGKIREVISLLVFFWLFLVAMKEGF